MSGSSASSMEHGGNHSPTVALSRQGSHNGTTMSANIDIDDVIAMIGDRRGCSLRSETISTCRTQTSMEELLEDSHSIPIDEKLVKLLVSGSKKEVSSLGVELCDFKCREDNNTVLHVAAINSSQAELINDILPISKDMIKWKNSEGDLAFHSAAKAGRLDTLKALSAWGKYDSKEERIERRLLGMGNEEGDTPLHIAVENNQKEMAEYLMDEYGEACYKLNKKMVSPIYLAIKAGYWDLVKLMIAFTKEHKQDSGDALLRGKSVVHAAIESRNLEILQEILKTHENLIELYDEEHGTPLSSAAFKGYLEGVRYLLTQFPNSAYRCNKDDEGSFPIHKAASGGHIEVIKELHGTKHLRNRKGQNILHMAAENGKSEAVSYLLKMQELESLINLKDKDGNTPLHLATLGFHPRVVYILTRERKVKPELKNKDGLTALDLAEIHAGSNPKFEARLTWMALRYIDAPRSSQSTRRRGYVQTEKQRQEKQRYQNPGQRKQNKEPNDKQQLESFKNRIDTHLLVATLVATVTFAAGFTLPGGYKQDNPQIGMVVLPHKWAFQVFVICDTAALYSSILAVVLLIWAYMEDLKLILLSLKFALPLLGFSLAMMALAFMMGVYVVLRNELWLAYVVLGIGSVFLVAVLVFFIPLYNPSYIRNSVVRFFFSRTLLLLLLVCEKSKIDYA